jgi:uncharacterized protein YdhG (YjbR/CyaY superfamily)
MDEKLLIFKDYIDAITNESNRSVFQELLVFVLKKFPQLETVVKWNQPMFLDHGTYIIAFNVTKKHINIAPERATMIYFEEEIKKRAVGFTKMFVQMKWNQPIDYDLLKKMISYNIIEKEHTKSFWR